MRWAVGEPNWQANLLKQSWQTQRMRSEPSETHRIVICLATETPLLEGVGQRQSFLGWLNRATSCLNNLRNNIFKFSLLLCVSLATNISKQTHQTFHNSLCKRPNHTSAKVTQNLQGSQNPLLDITLLVLQLLLQNFDFAGRFEFFDLNVIQTRGSPVVYKV